MREIQRTIICKISTLTAKREAFFICIISVLVYIMYYGLQYCTYSSFVFQQFPSSTFLQLRPTGSISFGIESNQSKILYYNLNSDSICCMKHFSLVVYSVNLDNIKIYGKYGSVPTDISQAIIYKVRHIPNQPFTAYENFYLSQNQVYADSSGTLYMPIAQCHQTGRYYFVINNLSNYTQPVSVSAIEYNSENQNCTRNYNTFIILIFHIIAIMSLYSLRLLFQGSSEKQKTS